MAFRTDEHKNPTAFTTDIAKEAGLVLGVDYEMGKQFPGGIKLYTAKLLGDPIAITIKVIDKISFYTKLSAQRWSYIAIPKFIWLALTYDQKKAVIGFMYKFEGGQEMSSLFK